MAMPVVNSNEQQDKEWKNLVFTQTLRWLNFSGFVAHRTMTSTDKIKVKAKAVIKCHGCSKLDKTVLDQIRTQNVVNCQATTQKRTNKQKQTTK